LATRYPGMSIIKSVIYLTKNIMSMKEVTYIDDAAFVDTAGLLPASVDLYIRFQHLDSTTTTMGIVKMMYRLFVLIPIGSTTVRSVDMKNLTGTLSWNFVGGC